MYSVAKERDFILAKHFFHTILQSEPLISIYLFCLVPFNHHRTECLSCHTADLPALASVTNDSSSYTDVRFSLLP